MCDFVVETLNEGVLKAQYAVRGEILARAKQIQNEMKEGKKFPFSNIIAVNIGNPQALSQKPITFFRQVVALCEYPQLLEAPEIQKVIPEDARQRAKAYLAATTPGGTGAYSDSQGVLLCRQHIAEGIERRDGYPSRPEDIFLTEGASGGVHYLLKMLIRGPHDCILTPLPQYPLYSAAIALQNGTLLPYYLKEEDQWSIDVSELQQQVDKARGEGKCVRALVVINPGNPVGAVLDPRNVREIVEFCKKEGLVVVADEVYQENVYCGDKKFVSVKKVVRDLGPDYESLPLFSLHSISKGFYGECGHRAGYMELVGVPQGIRDQLVKLASINLCPNVPGQLIMAMVMHPPQEGEESYELFVKERDAILSSLQRRALMLEGVFNEMEGVKSQPIEGALYAFPQVTVPAKALEEAEKSGKHGDFLYCMKALEATGIVMVPGSGFGQKDGTYHFRTTILPQENEIQAVCDRLSDFHKSFMEQYRS